MQFFVEAGSDGSGKAGHDRSLATADTIRGDTGTTASINPASTTSSIEFGYVNTPGDTDWFRMPVVAGTRYTIILTGYSSAQGGPALPSPTVRVYDSGGQLVGSGGSINGASASYVLDAQTSGHVFVSAEGTNGTTGRYSTLVITSAGTTPDTVPGDSSTGARLTVGGSVTGRIDSDGDTDWFRIELTAGQLYEFKLDATGGELDPLLQLRDGSGRVVAENDDGADGLDSRITFLAETGGTYFLTAGAFDKITGDYRLSAATTQTNDLLSTIDWGQGVPGDRVITVYFVPAGETRDGRASLGWNDYEIGRAMAAMAAFSAVTPLSFVRVFEPVGAEFQLLTADDLEPGEFGFFSPPGEIRAGIGVFARDMDGWDEGGGGGLEAGGLGFVTLVHEIGHGLGLAHPHDTGGTSQIMTGVNGPDGSYGLFGLNQGVFTTMTYNDGWPLAPLGLGAPSSSDFGHQMGPMALDIAVLQRRYGANTDHRGGDDVYTVPEGNRPVMGYQAIWDTGGRDRLEYRGFGSAVLDLRSATLDYSATGGGVVSHVGGQRGGFTIAAGVIIEDALGGFGADLLQGNAAANLLEGGGGDDRQFGADGDDVLGGQDGADYLNGGSGRDQLYGDAGDDILIGGGGDDRLDGGAGFDTISFEGATEAGVSVDLRLGSVTGGADIGVDTFRDVESLRGTDLEDSLIGSEGNNRLEGLGGADRLFGLGGDDLIGGQSGADLIEGGSGRDALYGDSGDDTIGGQEDDDFLAGGAGNDGLFGDGGNDTLNGDDGNDFIEGKQGDDRAAGGEGDDLVGGQDGRDFIEGGGGNDRLYGDADDDLIGGQDGRDLIEGGSGDDRLYGDAGDDTIGGQDGADLIEGGAGADGLYGDGGDDTIGGQDGNDFIEGKIGNDRLFGDGGADLIGGQDGNDFIEGGVGDDSLFGDAGDDRIGGQDGVDRIEGGQGADRLYGDGGDDFMRGGAGDDLIDGGFGFDIAYFSGVRSAYTITVGNGFLNVIGPDGTDTLVGVERLQFDDGAVSGAPTPDDWVL